MKIYRKNLKNMEKINIYRNFLKINIFRIKKSYYQIFFNTVKIKKLWKNRKNSYFFFQK